MNHELIRAEWRRSEHSLQAAEKLLEAGLLEDSVSRSYYAAFHAVRGALFARDLIPRTHAGVRRLFGSELVASGDIEAEWAKVLAQLQDRREDAEYDVAYATSKELAGEIFDQARRLRQRIGRFLLNEGVDPDDGG